jgi:peroxiredoxin
MAEKLNLGATLPGLTLNLVSGGRLTLPDSITTPYAILLFYRGHW